MRADLAFRAIAHEPNRCRLAKRVAKATRMLHRPNTHVQDTMNDAFERFGCSKPRATRRAAEAASNSQGRAA